MGENRTDRKRLQLSRNPALSHRASDDAFDGSAPDGDAASRNNTVVVCTEWRLARAGISGSIREVRGIRCKSARRPVRPLGYAERTDGARHRGLPPAPPQIKSPGAAILAAFNLVRAHRLATARIHEVQPVK